MTELTPTYAVQSYIDAYEAKYGKTTEISAAGIIEHLEASGFAVVDGDRHEIVTTLRHARTFIVSREKMHPDGVKLYDELLAHLSNCEQPAGQLKEGK